jgi:hypothetical protein
MAVVMAAAPMMMAAPPVVMMGAPSMYPEKCVARPTVPTGVLLRRVGKKEDEKEKQLAQHLAALCAAQALRRHVVDHLPGRVVLHRQPRLPHRLLPG